jgi:hypothetical protein
MGQFYQAVCHDCQVSWTSSSLQIEEILENTKAIAELGGFFVEHRHHRVDLVGDAGDDGGCNWDMVNKYREKAWFELNVIGA